MKHLVKVFGIGLLVMGIVMTVSAASYAGTGSAQKWVDNTPPNGIVMHGDAKGIKLYGSMSIEYNDYFSDNVPRACQHESKQCIAESNVVLQLQTSKGNIIKTYFKKIYNLPADANDQVLSLISEFKSDILADFFGGENLNIVLVSLGEYQTAPSVDSDPNYIIASITLAVN